MAKAKKPKEKVCPTCGRPMMEEEKPESMGMAMERAKKSRTMKMHKEEEK